jgi:phosphoribosylamine---glycine ligase
MRILVVGSGGREHAICYAMAQSSRVSQLYCAPGNAGIAAIADCVAIKHDEIDRLASFAVESAIDLTFVGGETPLALGIVDEFEKRGLKIIGASRAAARLESSKAFAKAFMSRHGIPTGQFRIATSTAEAIEILEAGHFGRPDSQVVVKADGLAAGKGVVVATDRAEAITACSQLAQLVGERATEKIVLEEFLEGREVSLLMFADGKDFALMPPVRDHKRIGEGDTGPNTGGMGTITDAALLDPAQTQAVIKEIIEPTLAGCIAEGFPFRGILFLGLMMTQAGPKLLEYNVRFGDPETQSILVRLESDIVEVCDAMLNGTLSKTQIRWREGNSACVVLATAGYPHNPRTGDLISGIDAASRIPDVTIFHAGTAFREILNGTFAERGPSFESRSRLPAPESKTDFVTAGGRVLGVTATREDLDTAILTAYRAAELISWKGIQFRHDIGR